MYKGFKLSLTEGEIKLLLDRADLVGYCPLSPKVTQADMLSALKSESANWIMDNWFKSYDADVFISHSSKDREVSERIASLFTGLGLKVFIDSDVWGRIDDLQKRIDDENAVMKVREDGSRVYSYEKRNITTGHVHVLLTHALQRMIDKTECFLFLETPSSAVTCSKDNLDTYSPWLFHELETVNCLPEKDPQRPRLVAGSFSKKASAEALDESIKKRFTARVAKLTNVTLKQLLELVEHYFPSTRQADSSLPQYFLDYLYRI